MFKVLWLLRRKPGITHEQFRDHYENSHAILGQKYLGHLMLDYKRNYRTATAGGGVPTDPKGSALASHSGEWEYDCVTEWVMPNEAAFDVHAELADTKAFVERIQTLIDHPFDVTRTLAIV